MNSLGDVVFLEKFLDVLGFVLKAHARLMGIVGLLKLIQSADLLVFEPNVLVTF
jgi:hypothetical protein